MYFAKKNLKWFVLALKEITLSRGKFVKKAKKPIERSYDRNMYFKTDPTASKNGCLEVNQRNEQ